MNIYWENNPNLEINLGRNIGNNIYSKPPKYMRIINKPLHTSINSDEKNYQIVDQQNIMNNYINFKLEKSIKPFDELSSISNTKNQKSVHHQLQKEKSLDNILEKSITSSVSIENCKSHSNTKINKNLDAMTEKKERSQKVKEIFEQIRRKTNRDQRNVPQSSNTDLRIYGELFPGPGDYSPNIGSELSKKYINSNQNSVNIDGKQKQNLGLLVKKFEDKFYGSKIGPGSYNINSKSYSQNQKGFISSLARPAFIKEDEMNPNVGPGSYEIVSEFDKNKINCLKSISFCNRKNQINSNRLLLIEKNMFNGKSPSLEKYESKNNNRYKDLKKIRDSSKKRIKNIFFSKVKFENDFLRKNRLNVIDCELENNRKDISKSQNCSGSDLEKSSEYKNILNYLNKPKLFDDNIF